MSSCVSFFGHQLFVIPVSNDGRHSVRIALKNKSSGLVQTFKADIELFGSPQSRWALAVSRKNRILLWSEVMAVVVEIPNLEASLRSTSSSVSCTMSIVYSITHAGASRIECADWHPLSDHFVTVLTKKSLQLLAVLKLEFSLHDSESHNVEILFSQEITRSNPCSFTYFPNRDGSWDILSIAILCKGGQIFMVTPFVPPGSIISTSVWEKLHRDAKSASRKNLPSADITLRWLEECWRDLELSTSSKVYLPPSSHPNFGNMSIPSGDFESKHPDMILPSIQGPLNVIPHIPTNSDLKFIVARPSLVSVPVDSREPIVMGSVLDIVGSDGSVYSLLGSAPIAPHWYSPRELLDSSRRHLASQQRSQFSRGPSGEELSYATLVAEALLAEPRCAVIVAPGLLSASSLLEPLSPLELLVPSKSVGTVPFCPWSLVDAVQAPCVPSSEPSFCLEDPNLEDALLMVTPTSVYSVVNGWRKGPAVAALAQSWLQGDSREPLVELMQRSRSRYSSHRTIISLVFQIDSSSPSSNNYHSEVFGVSAVSGSSAIHDAETPFVRYSAPASILSSQHFAPTACLAVLVVSTLSTASPIATFTECSLADYMLLSTVSRGADGLEDSNSPLQSISSDLETLETTAEDSHLYNAVNRLKLSAHNAELHCHEFSRYSPSSPVPGMSEPHCRDPTVRYTRGTVLLDRARESLHRLHTVSASLASRLAQQEQQEQEQQKALNSELEALERASADSAVRSESMRASGEALLLRLQRLQRLSEGAAHADDAQSLAEAVRGQGAVAHPEWEAKANVLAAALSGDILSRDEQAYSIALQGVLNCLGADMQPHVLAAKNRVIASVQHRNSQRKAASNGALRGEGTGNSALAKRTQLIEKRVADAVKQANELETMCKAAAAVAPPIPAFRSLVEGSESRFQVDVNRFDQLQPDIAKSPEYVPIKPKKPLHAQSTPKYIKPLNFSTTN